MSKAYAARLHDLLKSGEGLRYQAYLDTSDIETVGKGFNLRDPLVSRLLKAEIGEDQFKEMLADAKREPEDKRVTLTDKTINKVYDAVLADKERVVADWYKGINLNDDQRAVITDLAYQGHSKFVGPNTEFFKAVKRGDWDSAINEVKNRSNLNQVEGIQNRMNERAEILKASVVMPDEKKRHSLRLNQTGGPVSTWTLAGVLQKIFIYLVRILCRRHK